MMLAANLRLMLFMPISEHVQWAGLKMELADVFICLFVCLFFPTKPLCFLFMW